MTVRKRVEAFLDDHYQAWLTQSSSTSPDMQADFDGWRTLLMEVNERHMGAQNLMKHGASTLGNESNYGPTSTIVAVKDGGNRAEVEVKLRFGYEVFKLQRRDEDWRIVAIEHFQKAAGTPMVDPERCRALLKQVDEMEPGSVAVPAGDDPNCDALFRLGTLVGEGSNRCAVEHVERRSLHLASGVVGVYDLSWSSDQFAPRDRRLAPGTYLVEIASGRAGILALRLVVQEGTDALFYRQACALGNAHSSVGIDGGYVALFDAEAYLQAESREVEDLERRGGLGVEQPRSEAEIQEIKDRVDSMRMPKDQAEESLDHLLSMPNFASETDLSLRGPRQPVDLVLCQAGHGDGSYPVYWGLDETGEVTSLVIDFLVAAEWQREPLLLEFDEPGQTARHPLLDELGMKLRLDDGDSSDGEDWQQQLNLAQACGSDGDLEAECKATSADGLEIDTNGHVSSSSDWNRRYWNATASEVKWPVVVETTLITGYRNGFAKGVDGVVLFDLEGTLLNRSGEPLLGAPELIARMNSDLRFVCGIFTTESRENAAQKLENADLIENFSIAVLGEDRACGEGLAKHLQQQVEEQPGVSETTVIWVFSSCAATLQRACDAGLKTAAVAMDSAIAEGLPREKPDLEFRDLSNTEAICARLLAPVNSAEP